MSEEKVLSLNILCSRSDELERTSM